MESAARPDGAETSRLVELDRYQVLDDPPPDELQSLVDLAAQVCDVHASLVSVISRNHHVSLAASGLDAEVMDRADSLCSRVLHEPGLVVVPDAGDDERFADSDYVNGRRAAVRFYASAPLITPTGVHLGRLCVLDTEPGELSEQQGQALQTLAQQAMDVIELRRRGRELEASLRELVETREALRRTHENVGRFAHQVGHDLRNPLTAILASAEMLADEPAVEDDAGLDSLVGAVSAAGERLNRMLDEALTVVDENLPGSEEPTPPQPPAP